MRSELFMRFMFQKRKIRLINDEVVKLYYRDYEVIHKWWKRKFAIIVNGEEIEFETLESLKLYVNDLYNQ
mgnify:FL=1